MLEVISNLCCFKWKSFIKLSPSLLCAYINNADPNATHQLINRAITKFEAFATAFHFFDSLLVHRTLSYATASEIRNIYRIRMLVIYSILH